MERRRVVVTGLGVVSPIGNDIPSFWESVKVGRSGIGLVSLVDVSDMAVRIAGEVKDFNPSLRIDPKEAKKMDRYTQFAVYAAAEALADAGLSRETIESERTGVCIGTGQGGSNSIEEAVTRLVEPRPHPGCLPSP